MQIWVCSSGAESWGNEEVFIVGVYVRVIGVCKGDSSFKIVPICDNRAFAIHVGLCCKMLLAVATGDGIDGCIAEVASSGGLFDRGCLSFLLLPELSFVLYLLLRQSCNLDSQSCSNTYNFRN